MCEMDTWRKKLTYRYALKAILSKEPSNKHLGCLLNEIKMSMNETFFGILFHQQLRRWSYFQYEDERPEYVPPRSYMIGYKSSLNLQESKKNNQIKQEQFVEGPPTGLASAATSKDDAYIIDWNGPQDKDNPYNWSSIRKGFFLFQIMLLTTSVYMGSAIVSPAIPTMAQFWHIGFPTASLSISLFVLGYGFGPMLGICSASEIVYIGRIIPYMISLILFVILQVPTALVDGVGSFMVLRFLAGLFGSPPLATGGASVQDVWNPATAPIAMGMWGVSAAAGPVLGPVIGGFAVQGFLPTSLGLAAWKWSIWPLLILTGFTLAVLIVTMPETSAGNILSRRAQRLRKLTGNPHLRSRGEIISAQTTPKELITSTLLRPWRLGLFEPISMCINLHIGLVYGVLYSFFEAFPIAFQEIHHFNLGEGGLAFMGIFVGVLLSYGAFCWYFLAYFRPLLNKAQGRIAPELWLQPAFVGGICLPLSLFVFGWTVSPHIHWSVPIVGSMIFAPGIFGLFAAGLNYLAFCYGENVASVFAANDFMRASIGAMMPLVSRQMFNNLNRGPIGFPIAWGCTLLGCIASLMAIIPFILARYGPALRKSSKYATDPDSIHTHIPREDDVEQGK